VKVIASSRMYVDQEVELAAFVEWELDGSDYGLGELETVQRTLENIRRAIGVLTEACVEAGLPLDVVNRMLPDSSRRVLPIVPEREPAPLPPPEPIKRRLRQDEAAAILRAMDVISGKELAKKAQVNPKQVAELLADENDTEDVIERIVQAAKAVPLGGTGA